MESFKLVSASRVTLAVERLFLQKKVTLQERTNLVHADSLARLQRQLFRPRHAQYNIKDENGVFPALCLRHFII